MNKINFNVNFPIKRTNKNKTDPLELTGTAPPKLLENLDSQVKQMQTIRFIPVNLR